MKHFLIVLTLICVVAASETYVSEDGKVDVIASEPDTDFDEIDVDVFEEDMSLWNRFLRRTGFIPRHKTCRNGKTCKSHLQCKR
jgi:hypothetical protein